MGKHERRSVERSDHIRHGIRFSRTGHPQKDLFIYAGLKPLDETILHEVGRKFQRIITIENGVRNGGLGSAVLEWMSDHGYQPRITRMGLPDRFVEHGTVDELRHIVGIDKESIKKEILT